MTTRSLLSGAAAVLGLTLWAPSAFAEAHKDETPEPRTGTLATYAPLGKGTHGMAAGGGIAVLLPIYVFEYGYGVGRRVDLALKYETVVGTLHFSHVAVRWSPIETENWNVGFRGGLSYSFFGIQTDQLNLTSTLYLKGEAGASGRVSEVTDVSFGLGTEFDLVEFNVFDGEEENRRKFEYDATIIRTGMQTQFFGDSKFFLNMRLRIPVETFRAEQRNFHVVPIIDVGAAWAW